MKLLIIVPVYNEEETLSLVIKDLKSHGYDEIIVVDDGSTDKSSHIAKQAKIILRHVINRGLGAALGTGFEYARKVNADIVVTFDSDGQHRAQDIKKLIRPIIKNQADVVIGSRLLDFVDQMPKDRLILNKIANILTYLFYGFWSTDSQSGLRAFNKEALSKIQIKTDRMEISSEFLKEIGRNKFRYVEVPVCPIYTKYSRSSGQNNWNSLSVGIKMLLRLFR